MPHKPISHTYEPFDDWLGKRIRSEALSAQIWTNSQIKHIDDFYESLEQVAEEVPLETKEEKARKMLLELAKERKLTGPERRRLARLQRKKVRSQNRRSRKKR